MQNSRVALQKKSLAPNKIMQNSKVMGTKKKQRPLATEKHEQLRNREYIKKHEQLKSPEQPMKLENLKSHEQQK